MSSAVVDPSGMAISKQREFLASYVQTAIVGFHGPRDLRVTVFDWGVAVEPRWRILQLIGAPTFEVRWDDVEEVQALVRISQTVGVRLVLRCRGELRHPHGLTRLDQPMTRRVTIVMGSDTDAFVSCLPEFVARRDKRELLPTTWFIGIAGIGGLLTALGAGFGHVALVLVGAVLACGCLMLAAVQATWLKARS